MLLPLFYHIAEDKSRNLSFFSVKNKLGKKKRAAEAALLGVIPLFFLLKGVLPQSADGALEVLGKLLEGGAGGDAVAVTQKSSGEREPTACFV